MAAPIRPHAGRRSPLYRTKAEAQNHVSRAEAANPVRKKDVRKGMYREMPKDLVAGGGFEPPTFGL